MTGRCWTLDAIIAEHRRRGFLFFSPGSMRLFRSRIGKTVYQGVGGVFFTTSEQFVGMDGRKRPRRYTVREFLPRSGEIRDATTFQALGTAREAKGIAERLAKGEEAVA